MLGLGANLHKLQKAVERASTDAHMERVLDLNRIFQQLNTPAPVFAEMKRKGAKLKNGSFTRMSFSYSWRAGKVRFLVGVPFVDRHDTSTPFFLNHRRNI